MGAERRPVDLPPARDEDEHVVVRAPADHDRPEELPELDPLQLGALLRAPGRPRPDHLAGEVGSVEGTEGRRLGIHVGQRTREFSGPGRMGTKPP